MIKIAAVEKMLELLWMILSLALATIIINLTKKSDAAGKASKGNPSNKEDLSANWVLIENETFYAPK